jgi:hypothetical protein
MKYCVVTREIKKENEKQKGEPENQSNRCHLFGSGIIRSEIKKNNEQTLLSIFALTHAHTIKHHPARFTIGNRITLKEKKKRNFLRSY